VINENTHSGPSFSLKSRIGRLIWSIFYFVLFRYSPRPVHGWRRAILRLFGAKIGKGVHVYPGLKVWAPWNLEISDFAGVASGVNLYSQGKITIGKYAVVSQGSHICAGTHVYEVPGFPLITKPIIIGDYAWVAADVFVHPGVKIGEGAVIGARSVVATDIPEWKIAVGFPCKVIKDRLEKQSKDAFIHKLES